MHLVIYFCGTDDSGYPFARDHAKYAQELKDNNTHTLIVNGCHHSEVCDNGMTPDINEFANRFMSTAFKKNENGEVFLAKSNSNDLAKLGVGIQNAEDPWVVDYEKKEYVQIPKGTKLEAHQKSVEVVDKQFTQMPNNSFKDKNEPIESITFVGYSRGAVTCFNAALVKEKLLGTDVPVRIVADQPVPGNLYALPGTNAANIADCSKLKSVEKVDLTVAAYTGVTSKEGFSGKLRQLFHRLFFSQIVPKLPTEHCETNLSVIPRNNHWEGTLNGSQHVHMNLTKQLADEGLLNKDTAAAQKQVITNYYDRHPPVLPNASQMQGTFGTNVSHLYNHIDKEYVKSLSPVDYQGFLYKWWEAQETQASIFSTKLTRELVSAMRDTNHSNANEKLVDLFTKADAWLLMKEGSGSSRFSQVEGLRNEVRERLLQQSGDAREVMEARLNEINRNSMQSTHYYERQWQRESKAASWFKTDDTRALDKAFAEHAKAKEPSKENDEKLLAAMDQWLDKKQQGSSSRLELVGRMREQLAEQVKRYDSNLTVSLKEDHGHEASEPEEPSFTARM